MYEYETVLVDVEDHVATVTLNRPEVMNAMNLQMQKDFFDAVWALEADPDVRAIVITGAGKAFCSGIDLAAGDRVFTEEAHREHDETLGVDSDTVAERAAFWTMRTPTVCAINGAAIGAGLTVATLFDVRFAATDAKLRYVFTRLGILPEANINWLLPRIVGVPRALELLLSGRFFSGAEAAEWGLVNRAVAKEDVLTEAQAFAHDLATYCAPSSMAVCKHLVYSGLQDLDRLSAMQLETKLTWWLGTQPDAMEGVMAFMGKREPQWQGSKHVELPDVAR